MGSSDSTRVFCFDFVQKCNVYGFLGGIEFVDMECYERPTENLTTGRSSGAIFAVFVGKVAIWNYLMRSGTHAGERR